MIVQRCALDSGIYFISIDHFLCRGYTKSFVFWCQASNVIDTDLSADWKSCLGVVSVVCTGETVQSIDVTLSSIDLQIVDGVVQSSYAQ